MGTFLLWGVLGTLGVLCIIGICRWLDRLLLRAEEKGWIYYRKKSAGGSSSGFVGSAMIELDRVIRPSAEYRIQAESQIIEDEEIGGD